MYVVLTLKKKKKNYEKNGSETLWACWYTKTYRFNLVCSCEKEYVRNYLTGKKKEKEISEKKNMDKKHKCVMSAVSSQVYEYNELYNGTERLQHRTILTHFTAKHLALLHRKLYFIQLYPQFS